MSEELLQTAPHPIGRYRYYKLGASTLRQLKNAGIVKAPVPVHLLAKKPDGLIVLHGGAIKAVIEYKPPNRLKTESQIQNAIDQEIEVASVLCKLLIVTSGSKSIWINALNGEWVLGEDGTALRFVDDAKAIGKGNVAADELERLLDAADASLTDTHSIISAPSVLDPSILASTIWQKIWVQPGKVPRSACTTSSSCSFSSF